MTANGGCAVLTLRQAQEMVRREWPGRDAPDSAWLAYHQRAAQLYAQVARHDLDHHHEALFWAAQEQEAARVLTEPGPISQDTEGDDRGSR